MFDWRRVHGACSFNRKHINFHDNSKLAAFVRKMIKSHQKYIPFSNAYKNTWYIHHSVNEELEKWNEMILQRKIICIRCHAFRYENQNKKENQLKRFAHDSIMNLCRNGIVNDSSEWKIFSSCQRK